MIPRINNQGFSFKGVTDYLMHDKKAETDERVEWTHTGNLYTDDVFKAAKVMAYIDMDSERIKLENGGSSAGRKKERGSVYHTSIAWANEEHPTQQHQQQICEAYLEHQGLSEHQYYFVAHNDTNHQHVHIVVNLTHHETGKRAELAYDKRKAQEFALAYELENKMHCHQREENARLRGLEGSKNYYRTQKERHGVQVTRAYNASDDAKSFKNALELEGLQLAKGRKFLLAVDNKGNLINISRVIDGHTTRDIKAKFKDIDRNSLPDANGLVEEIKEQNKPYDRESEEIKRENKLEEAAHKFALEEEAREKFEQKEAHALAKQQRASQKAAERKAAQQQWGREQQEARKKRKDRLYEILRSIKSNEGKKDGTRLHVVDELAELRAKEQKAEKEALALNIEARKWKGSLDERVSKAREKHDIKGSKERLEEAQKQYEEYKDISSRLLKREQFEEAYDNLQNRQKQLEEQMRRFKLDIEAIHKDSTNAVDEELKKQGFSLEHIEEKQKPSQVLEQEQERIATEFEQVAQQTDESEDLEFEEMPEFDTEEQRRIWLAFKELEKNKDLDQDEGLEI